MAKPLSRLPIIRKTIDRPLREVDVWRRTRAHWNDLPASVKEALGGEAKADAAR